MGRINLPNQPDHPQNDLLAVTHRIFAASYTVKLGYICILVFFHDDENHGRDALFGAEQRFKLDFMRRYFAVCIELVHFTARINDSYLN